MSVVLLNFIHPTYISAFGVKAEYIYYVLIMIFITVCYNIVHPVMAWCIKIKSIKLLSYLFSSLLAMAFIWLMMLQPGTFDDFTFSVVKVTLKSLALFGIGLFIYRTFYQFINNP